MNLKGFPRRTLRGDRALFRIHRTTRSAWWFSGDGSGRFDPIGAGLGGCYLAEHPLGAWVEVFRKRMLVAERDVAQRSLLEVTLGRTVRIADLTSRRALAFGVTPSLGANEEYGPSQAFARRALDAGFDGIRYLVRHDPAQVLAGVALFSDAGAAAPNDPHWPTGVDREIDAALIQTAGNAFGYQVLPTP